MLARARPGYDRTRLPVAFSATLYEALYGERPHDGYVEETADTHLDLARALLAAHGNVTRARSLAERAAGEYARAVATSATTR